MKIILSEKQILTTIRLSGSQKAVLTKIIASTSEEQAYEQISDGRNLVAARDLLQKLKLIDFEEGSAEVTETGKKVMKDENLIDDSEELTPDGQQFATAEEPGDIKKQVPGEATPDTADDAGLGDEAGGEQAAAPGGEDELSLEGKENTMSLLKEINSSVTEGEDIRKLQREERAAKLKAMDKAIFGSGKNSRSDPYQSRKKKKFDKLRAKMKAKGELNENVMFSPQEFQLIQMVAKENEEAGDKLDSNDELVGRIQEFVVEVDPGWMPYGTQKARTGDPKEWIFNNIEKIADDLKSHANKFVSR